MNRKGRRGQISKGSLSEARTYAARLLHYRARSKKELIMRLGLRGFDDEPIMNTIRFLEDLDLINDERLASELFKYATEVKALGPGGVRMFLTKRGIDRQLIESTMAQHTDQMEFTAARDLAERKQRTLKNYPEDVVKRRLWGMLRRRGFSMDVIRKVMNLRER